MTDDIEKLVSEDHSEERSLDENSYWNKCKEYLQDCVNPDNARLYGTFQERAALNITQFPKIQGSLLIRMGLVYPIMSYLMEEAGVPKDAQSDFCGIAINYHTWLAGYLAYLAEIQLGMSKYPIELVSSAIEKGVNYFKKN